MLAVSWRSKELDYSTAAESRAIVLVQREKKFLLHFFFFLRYLSHWQCEVVANWLAIS